MIDEKAAAEDALIVTEEMVVDIVVGIISVTAIEIIEDVHHHLVAIAAVNDLHNVSLFFCDL